MSARVSEFYLPYPLDRPFALLTALWQERRTRAANQLCQVFVFVSISYATCDVCDEKDVEEGDKNSGEQGSATKVYPVR